MSSNTSTIFAANFRLLTRSAVVLAICLAAGGCDQASAKAKEEAQRRLQPTYDRTTGKLTKLSYDSNSNGKPDTWAFMDGAKLVRLEADENEDALIDRWEFYPEGEGVTSAKGPPDRIERATHGDGKVSRREFFEGGALVRIEEDVDGNSAVDKWETYAGGALTIMSLDTTGAGKPDRRLIYRADGSLDRIEADPTGSGVFQTIKQ
ncbi:MAG: hypothetical protein ABIS06_10180 [Vicinamibacterales bacterium]